MRNKIGSVLGVRRGRCLGARLAGLLATVSLASGQVSFQKQDGQMEISVAGKPFATYVWNDPETTRPYFKQVHSPDGVQVTRNHPPQPGDIGDHETYHPGIWWGFGDVGGNDYWRMKARIVGGEFVEGPEGGNDRGSFAVRNRMLTNQGNETFCEQVSRYTILPKPNGVLLICETELKRDQGDFWLGDQEEMGLAVRVATSIAMESKKGGRIVDSEGRTELKEIRTNQSDWCDYSGPAGGRFAGITIMHDPANFRRPWWHAVETGLLVANPLGESELHGQGKRKENVLVKQGEPFRLRYGVFVHSHARDEDFSAGRAYEAFLKAIETARKKRPSKAELPKVPDGFEVSVFAEEPLIYKPTSICFDGKGRLMLGQGPQYPKHNEQTPPDRILLLLDTDGDGVADQTKTFAEGFNSIQGMAWKGKDLYVANAPELTIVRDLDGDDEADEYVMVYTDLGNREHALHGLNWGPDGKLYMSKGNSKGHNQPEKYGYVAPRPFRELWDVVHPPDAPDFYSPKVFTKETYRKTYHDPDDDWGREGGVLRCDPLGTNLEILSRGMRNPWDMTMDDGFNWLGTDNDQDQGDRVIMPFFGAHFGWGHTYSSHWTGENHLPTAPISGPVFHGSGAGIVFYSHPHFPTEYRDAFFINDWLYGTFVYRPVWEGALMQPAGGRWEHFAKRGEGEMFYRPTDLEFGPDGTLYSCGWGNDYHYQPGKDGSWIFRIQSAGKKPALREEWFPDKRSKPYADWKVDELIADLGPDMLPVWRVNAQDELVRRGTEVRAEIVSAIESGRLNKGQETWAVWALGRIAPDAGLIDEWMRRMAQASRITELNLRLQALRILAHRVRDHAPDRALPEIVLTALKDPDPRVRFEAVQALWQARKAEWVPALLDWLAQEQDRLVFYAGWGALRDLTDVSFRKTLLNDPRANVRLAALLSLLERHDMELNEVLNLAERDPDPRIQEWSSTWVLNPVPPKKMPNTTSRIELESSVSVSDLITRVKEAPSPRMRILYLTMISRATYRRDRDWNQLRELYGEFKRDDERALVLTAVGREPKALPMLWDALAGNEALQREAVEALARLARRGGDVPIQIADFLLDQMDVDSRDVRVPAALEAMARLDVPKGWRPPSGWDRTFSEMYGRADSFQVRSRILGLLLSMDDGLLAQSAQIKGMLTEASSAAAPGLYPSLVTLNKRLGIDVEMKVPEPATVDGVMALVQRGDAKRGSELFFSSQSGAACFSCHRVQGQGQSLAPDLSGIGLRSDARTIVQSIVEPSAVITEGYRLHEIETDGFSYSGAVLQETDSEVHLVRQDGYLERIPVRAIVARRSSDLSAMPSNFGELLSKEQIADLTAFLLTCRHPSTGTAVSQAKAESTE